MNFLESAFHLCQFGFKVFPLAPGHKIPAISKDRGGRGCLDATDDEEIIADWAYHIPKANIGIATGTPSGVMVVDLDPRNGSEASIEALASRKQTFPATVVARTANGGQHLYFAVEDGLLNSKSSLAPGIDVKTTGGYVVAPPSVLVGGLAYRWLNSPLGDQFPRLPRWAAEALKPKPKPEVVFSTASAPDDVAGLLAFVGKSSVGERNNVLFWAACRMAEQGVLGGANEAALIQAARASGLDIVEIGKTVTSAKSKGKLGGSQ